MLPNKVEIPTDQYRWMTPRLDGLYYELAIALNQHTDWPMVKLVIDGTIRHVGVRRPDGLVQDARGTVDEQTFVQPFLDTAREHIICPITRGEIVALHDVRLSLVRQFFNLIPLLWPDLPCSQDHMMQKVAAFAEDLRELSLRHGICLRTSVPTERMHFAFLKGDEQYVLAPTDDGFGWTIRREIVK